MYKPSEIILRKNDSAEIQEFGNYIAKLVHDCFDNKLPNKKGKPQHGREWTVLAGVVAEEKLEDPSHTNTEVGFLIFEYDATLHRNIKIHNI